MPALSSLQRFTLPSARIFAMLLAFSIPLSVALDNLLLAALLVLVLFGSGRAVLGTVRDNPVARAAWLLFGMLLLASFYGATPLREAFGTLGKYVDLALLPLLMVALAHHAARRMAQQVFLLAMAFTLALSGMVGMEMIAAADWMWRGALPDNPAVFRSSITQNILMAYAVFLALLHAREARVDWQRAGYGMFALLGSINVLFQVQGRTGYIVLLVLLAWFAWSTLARRLQARGRRMGWREAGAVAGVAVLAVWGAYQGSARLQARVDLVVSEYRAWQPNVGNFAANRTSTGQRMEFYYNTARIILEHPLAGVGTGGFPAAYAQRVQGKGLVATQNPHNEYLLAVVHGGVALLLLLLYWFYVQWHHAPQLETPFAQDAARGLVLAAAISCLFNSSLLDHTEGLFFAFMSALLFAGLKPVLSLSKRPVPGAADKGAGHG